MSEKLSLCGKFKKQLNEMQWKKTILVIVAIAVGSFILGAVFF